VRRVGGRSRSLSRESTSAYQIVGAWNADGKGLSIWDIYADTLREDQERGQLRCRLRPLPPLQEDVALQDRVHWKLEEWRVCPGSLPVLGWLGKGVHLRLDV
jgi:Glycosyl hydrolase family 1